MPAEITMPQLSDTMSEGTLVKWLKKEGDKVKAGEEIAEVETDKATMPMEAFESGTLAVVSVAEGDKVKVGDRLAVIALAGENAEDVKKQFAGGGTGASETKKEPAQEPDRKKEVRPAEGKAPPPKPDSSDDERAAPARGVPAKAGSTARRAGGQEGGDRVEPPAAHHGTVATLEGASTGELHEPDEVGHGATRQAPTAVPPVRGGNGRGRVFASPLARRIAEDHGVDLSRVRGSGPGGRIVQADVLAYSGKSAKGRGREDEGPKIAPIPPPPTPTSRVPAGDTQVVPLTKMRATIAQRLQQAKQQIPHIYLSVDIDMEELSALRERANKQLEAEKIRLSIGDFIAKAVASALQRHPALNAHFNAERSEIIRFGDVHLGMAVALPDGLIVPVLRNVHRMGVREIREKSAELVERARSQRLKQEEMNGATFTVTNLGTYGVRSFDAIVNPPAVAILAIATAERRPVVRDGAIVPRTVMTVTLSTDHRAVDGATAAEFLRTLKSVLEEPGMMLL